MKIVAATDLTERSDRALERAVMLAREMGADLTVLHVVDDELPDEMASDQERDALTSITEALAALDDRIAERTSVEVCFGAAWNEIVRHAAKARADLLVLGIPRPVLLRDLRGTTAERVLRNSPVPILLVARKPTNRYATIVAGTDFSVPARLAIEFAARVAPDAKLRLVHAYDIPFRGLMSEGSGRRASRKLLQQFENPIRTEMAAFVKVLPQAMAARGVAWSMREGAPEETLRREMRKQRSALVVLGTHGRTGLARAFLGSTTAAILSDPPGDVLAVKAW